MIERLDECLKVHADILDSTDIGDIYNLQDLAKLHYYLKVEHEFTPAEVEALLHFQNPLDVARWCWEENTHKHSFPICELLKEIDAYRQFPAFSSMPQKDRRSELMKRLGQNYYAFRESSLSLDKDTLFDNAQEIAKMQDVYSYLVEHFEFSSEDIEKMLLLENPLNYISARWSKSVSEAFDYEMDDFVQEDIDNISNSPQYFSQKEPESVKDRLKKAMQKAGEHISAERKSHDIDSR